MCRWFSKSKNAHNHPLLVSHLMSELPPPTAPSWLDAHRINEATVSAENLLRIVFGSTHDAPAAEPSIYARLVERRDRCRPDLGDWRALAPQPEVDRLLGRMVAILQGKVLQANEGSLDAAIDRVMSSRVDGCATLTARANNLRRISAEAEKEMERHFSNQWLEVLTDKIYSRVEPTSLVSLMSDFPYYDGYRELVVAEAALLSTPRRCIFGGCGPLPISGLLLALTTGAEVVLVDSDPQAAERCSQLIRALERRGFIPSDQIEVRHQNLSEISLDEPCDGIFVASLVNAEAKIRLAQRLGESIDPPPPLILRSAIGMCARIAYHAAPREAVVAAGLKYCGELVPSNHIVKGLDPVMARHFDVRSDRAEDLLGTLSSSVLNSAELYVSAAARDERDLSPFATPTGAL